MNKHQAVEQKLNSQKYIDANKLRPMFHELTKLLLLKRPEDPIQYLIDYLDKRNKRQIVCIHGYDEEKRIKLAKNVSIKFNYKLIELAELFKGIADWNAKTDQQINDKVMAELNKVESVYKGIIISGYPNNIVQTDFIQKSGILPERYFLLQNNQTEIKTQYNKKYEGDVDKILQRNKLELKELHQILSDQLDILPQNIDFATEVVLNTLGIKANRKTVPFDSMRICIVYPPFLKPQESEVFVNQFLLNPISINQTLKKLSHKPNFVTHVESYIRKHKSISKEIELAMIETMTKSATSKNKGFALYGWPHTKCRLPLMKQHFLNPHIIFVFEQTKQNALEKFTNLDPNNPDLFLVSQKPTKEEFSTLYDQYQDMVDELKSKNNVHVFSQEEKADKIKSTFFSLIENPKIYS